MHAKTIDRQKADICQRMPNRMVLPKADKVRKVGLQVLRVLCRRHTVDSTHAQSISYLRYFGFLPGIFWPLPSLGLLCEARTFFEVLKKVLHQILALRFFLERVMLDGDFQAVLLRIVFMLNGWLFRHCWPL